eukprot:Tbor_TRINITY_DN5866_c1_g1::TRINITY_DN5866_c1_g1_i1::g.7270::m.7270
MLRRSSIPHVPCLSSLMRTSLTTVKCPKYNYITSNNYNNYTSNNNIRPIPTISLAKPLPYYNTNTNTVWQATNNIMSSSTLTWGNSLFTSPLLLLSQSTSKYSPISPYTLQKANYFTKSNISLIRIGNTSFTSTAVQEGSGPSGNEDVITPQVRQHLIKVYSLLGLCIGVAAVGSSMMILTPLGKAIPFWAPMALSFIPMIWLYFKPPANPNARVALLLSFAVLEGMALGPLVKATAYSGVLGTALVLTGAVFLGFSASAFLAPRASMLALQGPLLGMLMGMVAISLLNIIYPTAFAHSIILYGGLALFSVLVAVDTQAMIERARCGGSDPALDAMGMFLNVINIFVRIAQILRSMSE